MLFALWKFGLVCPVFDSTFACGLWSLHLESHSYHVVGVRHLASILKALASIPSHVTAI